MKRLSGLWEALISFDNLYLAYCKARRGKRHRPEVARFSLNLEQSLWQLAVELKNGCYQPGEYRQFTIYEQKPRIISAAPFRDRVVHHAVMNLIEAPLDRRFIDDSYACRKHKGVHRAVARYQQWAKRYTYVLKLDVRQYFASIDHDILYGQLCRHIKDQPVLALLKKIIANGPRTERACVYFPGDDLFTPLQRSTGIPIGNLTSQFFANLYLNDMDHWLKERKRIPAYLRYVDDLFLLSDSKSQLWALKEEIEAMLATLRLSLHTNKAQIIPTRHKVDVLGYLIAPNKRWLRNTNGHRFARKLRRFAQGYADGRLSWDDFNPSVQSWIGHSRHGETEGLRHKLFNQTLFQRGFLGEQA